MNKRDRAKKLGCELAVAMGLLVALLGLAIATCYHFGFDVTGGTLLDTSLLNPHRLNMRETGVEFGGNPMLFDLLVCLINKWVLGRFLDVQ